MIEFKHVSKDYIDPAGQPFKALDNINLQIKQGEIFGIVGKSGAGKSTLIRCVNHLDVPSQGRIIVNDQCINELEKTALHIARRNIGMIFQHFNLLSSATVYENIALPLQLHDIPKAEWHNRIQPLLTLTHLENKMDSYPNQLSGGQKQRVAIARALATQPAVLLCDEVTSALDPHTTEAILQLLLQINQQLGVTVLLITHELAVIKRICDRVALLDQGKVIEEKTVIDFFAKPQTQLAQELVNTCMEHPLPDLITTQLHQTPQDNSHSLLRIRFNGMITAEPIIANLIQQQQVAINIVQANMEYIQDHALGTMIISLAHVQHQTALQYLANNGLAVEELGYVNRHA